jgi:hypothetical protein
MIDPAPKKNISICIGSRTCRRLFHYSRTDCPGSWVFFGTDIALEKAIRKTLSPNCIQIHIGEDLQKTAKYSRAQMVDYVGSLSTARIDDCWWLTTLSEKSPSSSRLFLHTCFLKMGMEYSRDINGSILFICESRSLAESLYANLLSRPGYSVKYYNSRFDSVKLLMRSFVTALSEKIWFLTRYTGRLIVARSFSLLHKKDPDPGPADFCTLIHSWADARSIADVDTYRDIYFGNLGERLAQKGIRVRYLLDVIPTIWYPRLVHAAWKNHIDFLLLEDFISWPDLLSSICRVWNLPRQIKDISLYGELDITSIVREELRNERYTSIGEHAYLCYCAGKKIGRSLKVKNFIFTYENQACQKFFTLAFRKYSPETTSVGYVHTYAIPMYTLYSVSEKEKNLMPLPDKIIVNGEQSKKYLVECGYPEERVFTGGALRYTYLVGLDITVRHKTKNSSDVLIAVSVNINEAVELIEKCLEAFSGKPAFNLTIKTHPTLPFCKIADFFPVLPENAIVSEIPVQELLARADLVLYTSSTVAIEAVAMGVPVIHVKSDHIIDMNFFDGESSIPSLTEPEEIAKIGEMIISRKEKMSSEESRKLVKKYFLSVDDSVISLFDTSK